MTPLGVLFLIAAVSAGVACIALWKRCGALETERRRLEEDSLQQRRELWKVQKAQRPTLGAAAGPDGSRPVPPDSLARLAAAVARVGGELAEARVLESTVRGALAVLDARSARIVLHDRRTDRFVRGPGAIRRDGEPALSEEAVRGAEEPLLRAAMKRRARVSREDRDPAVRALFEAAGGDVQAAIPLFDRALVAGLVLVDGGESDALGPALDVIAATASLALGNARLRSAGTSGSARSEADVHA